MKKLRAIFLVIDLILLTAVLVMGAICFHWFSQITDIPELQYAETMQSLDQQEQQIQQDRIAKEALVAQRNGESAELYAAAAEKLAASQSVYDAAVAERDAAQAMLDSLETKIEECAVMEQKIADLRVEYGTAVRQLEEMILAGESDYKICYLTFDDGPTYHTSDFLDELERLDVYATFFTIGIGVESWNFESIRDVCLRREALAGHSIANHTYTHAYYGPLYESVESFMDAVEKQDEVVYNATGLHTDIVRFPAGSYYCRYRTATIEELTEAGYQWIDWLGNSYDSGGYGYTSAYTANVVIGQARQEKVYVVLMHDLNRNTLGALDQIVTTLKAENYLFLPLFKESITMGDYTYPKWDN